MTTAEVFIWTVIGLPVAYFVTSGFQRELALPRHLSRGDDAFEIGLMMTMFLVADIAWPVMCVLTAVMLWDEKRNKR